MQGQLERLPHIAERLREVVEGVVSLGATGADADALTDSELMEGQRLVAEAQRLIDTYAARLAGAIARRSRHELGDEGMAAKKGFLSPEALIQDLTGTTRAEASKMVAVGTMMDETWATEEFNSLTSSVDGDDDATNEEAGGQQPSYALPLPWQAPIVHAVTSGLVSVDKAEAIRRGLGDIDAAVTAEKLREAVVDVLKQSEQLNADQVLKLARRVRNELDHAGIAAREKKAKDDEFLKVWRQHDGMVRISGLFAPENGEFLKSVYDAVTSPRRGGPRFVDSEQAEWAQRIKDDPRTTEQIAADAIIDLLRVGTEADPRTILGGRKPAVRVLVTEKTMVEKAHLGTSGHGYFEGNPNPITIETIEPQLCDTGTIGIKFDDNGQCVNVGREQRLFTRRQRVGLATRDGGCLYPDCDRPPSWCEAHHIDFWHRDHGRTDIADGVLLCRRHHLFLHNNGWEIVRENSVYWLIPPATIDPERERIELISKSPIMHDVYPVFGRRFT